jgi:hypothetical protein
MIGKETNISSAENKVEAIVAAQRVLAQKIFDFSRETNKDEVWVNMAIQNITIIHSMLSTGVKLSSNEVELIKLLLAGISVACQDENKMAEIQGQLSEIDEIIATIRKIKDQAEYDIKIQKMQELCLAFKEHLVELHEGLVEKGVDLIVNALPNIVEASNQIEKGSVKDLVILYTAMISNTLKQDIYEYLEKMANNIGEYIKKPLETIGNIQFNPVTNSRAKVVIEFPKGMSYGSKKFTKIIFIEPRVEDLLQKKEFSLLESLATKYDDINIADESHAQILLHRQTFIDFIKQTELLLDEEGKRINVTNIFDFTPDQLNFFLYALLIFLRNCNFCALKDRFESTKKDKDIALMQIMKNGVA